MATYETTMPFRQYNGFVTFFSPTDMPKGYYYDPFGPYGTSGTSTQSTVYSVSSSTTAVFGKDYQLRLYETQIGAQDLGTSSASYTLLPPSGSIDPQVTKYLYIVGLPNAEGGTKVLDINFNTKFTLVSKYGDGSSDTYITYYPELAHGTIETKLGLPDIRPLKVEGSPDSFKLQADGITAKASGNVTIGRSDGLFPMLNAAGASASYTKSEVNVASSTFSAAIGGVVGNLWGGSLKVDVPSRTGSINDDGVSGTFKLAGLGVDFKSVTLLQNSLAFDVLFKLPGETGGFIVDTAKVLDDAMIIDSSGAHFAAGGKLSIPNIPDLRIGPMALDADDVSVEYKAGEDSLYLQGKLTFNDPLANQGGVQTSVEADLTGENFLRIRDGKAELVGGLTIKEIPLTKGWALQEVSLSMNADKNTVTGSATISTPLGVKFGEGISIKPTLQFTYSPFHFDGAGIQVDNINKPIPFFPEFFFQSVGGSVMNLSPSSKSDVKISATIGATLGPQIKGSSLMRLDLTGEITSSELTGQSKVDFLPLEFEGLGVKKSLKLGSATGKTTLNYADWVLTQEGSFNFLDGLVKTETALRIDKDFNYGNFGKAAVGIPNFIPYFGGAEVANGAYSLHFSNDGTFGNDYVAGWGQYTIRKLGFEADITLGVRFNLDGTIERIGSHNVPAKPAQAFAASAFEFSGGDEWVISAAAHAPAALQSISASEASGQALQGAEYILLAAQWETVSPNAKLIVTMPDGTVVAEDQFAAHDIAIVDEFSSTTQRVAIAFNPQPGTWKVNIADPEGLGTVVSEVLGESAAPTFTFLEPIQQSGANVTINFSAFDIDSNAEITFWYDDDLTEANGLFIGSKTEADGAGSIVWNTQGAAPGEYHVYALVDDGDNPLVYTLSSSKVVVVANNAPTITSNGGGDTAAVSVAEGNLAAATVAATDAAAPALTYSIAGGADASKFTINAQTGALSFLQAPDFETPADTDHDNVYDVTVLVSDGELTDSQHLAVSVTNVGLSTARLVALTGFIGSAGGTANVVGTTGFQDLTIVDLPGELFLLGFGLGNDVLRFSGSASRYSVSKSANNLTISDGDTTVVFALSPQTTYLQFADGIRTAAFENGNVMVGSQVVTTSAQTITAGATAGAAPGLGDPNVIGRLFPAEAGPHVVAGGRLVVGGTSEAEVLEIDSGVVNLLAGFNSGTDRLHFSDLSIDYTARRSGGHVIIERPGTEIYVLGTPGGIILDFPDGQQLLNLSDIANYVLTIGDQVVTNTAQRLSPNTQIHSLDQGSVGAPAAINAGTGTFVFEDSAAATNVRLSNFGPDDIIRVTGATAASFTFAKADADNDGTADDLLISRVGQTDQIALLNMLSAAQSVSDLASAQAATGMQLMAFA